MLIKFFNCEEGCSFEGGVHLGLGALSNNYGIENSNKYINFYISEKKVMWKEI